MPDGPAGVAVLDLTGADPRVDLVAFG
jgi:hypothetical protein